MYPSKTKEKVKMNPFSEEYFATELAHYGLKEPYSKNGLSVDFEEQAIPYLNFDDTYWMTLKPKIIQTHYLSISRAKGVVLTGGLGLGYYPLRVAAKENVHRVDVYELDQRVIDFFLERFGDRPEMKKINLMQGDMRELASGHYDYVLVDIYLNPISNFNTVLEDLATLKTKVTASRIQVWCEELIIRVGRARGLDIILDVNEQEFLDCWGKAPSSISANLNQLYGDACYQLSAPKIRSYLKLVNHPFKPYYLSLIKWGFTQGIRKISRKLV